MFLDFNEEKNVFKDNIYSPIIFITPNGAPIDHLFPENIFINTFDVN